MWHFEANFLFLTVPVFYSPIPVAFHIIYKDKNVTAVVTTRYCFKQRAGQVLKHLGESECLSPCYVECNIGLAM